MISSPATPFSQRAVGSPLWSETFTKRRTGRGTARISRLRCETAMRGFASRGPPLARRNGAPHGRAAGGESDPGFLTAGAPSGRVSRFTSQFTVNPLLGGSLSPQGSLAGRPSSDLSRSRWMSVSACSFVTLLWLDVLLCIWMLHRVALPIRVSSQPRQRLQLRRTPMVEAWATVFRPAVFPWPAHTVHRHPMSSNKYPQNQSLVPNQGLDSADPDSIPLRLLPQPWSGGGGGCEETPPSGIGTGHGVAFPGRGGCPGAIPVAGQVLSRHRHSP